MWDIIETDKNENVKIRTPVTRLFTLESGNAFQFTFLHTTHLIKENEIRMEDSDVKNGLSCNSSEFVHHILLYICVRNIDSLDDETWSNNFGFCMIELYIQGEWIWFE